MKAPNTALGLLGLVTIAFAGAIPSPAPSSLPGCGEVNVILTGLPPNHPLVIAQGHDPSDIDKGLRADLASAIAGGYNVRMSLQGPEEPISTLEGRMEGTDWSATMVGAGVRASVLEELTIWLEDVIALYRRAAPKAFIAFNHNAESTLWAIQRRFPLASNCTDSPGTNLGYEIHCDPSVCNATISS
ncbi:hypothetical protein H2200_007471 [Cladophialophora chaetospira]|uniref:Uncharacterized protein n=1 Tax=Cladophialophora chaetospira TaxID=386627 RepID=A0AA38X8G5_9EURO|nr:hypothetical protein H2200_007471 [Cladophialophora chaetospira]